MKTSPLTYLAALLVGGAMLAGGKVSAQVHETEFSARPLPPLPTTTVGQRHSNNTQTQAQTVDSAIGRGRQQYRTLFTIESPPVPPGYDASARIVRPATNAALRRNFRVVDEATNPAAAFNDALMTKLKGKGGAGLVASSTTSNPKSKLEHRTGELTAVPEPAEQETSELISSSAFPVKVESQENLNPLPAVSTVRVAGLPQQLREQNENEPEAFFVAVQNMAPNGNLEPVLDAVPDAPVPNSPAKDIDVAEISQSTIGDEISIDPDSFKELKSEDGDSDIGEAEDNGGEDGELETDDLEEEDDDLQPEPRQFGVWPKKSMQEVSADIRNFYGEVPADESGALIASTQRFYRDSAKTEKVFAWAAPKIRYQPLYFEDAQLERYGQTKGLIKQPFVSGFKFFRDAALLPVNASIDCPGSCDGPLGFCRPGSPCGDSGCSSCQR